MIDRNAVTIRRFARESFWMRTVDEIAANGADVMRSLLMEAYNAGYAAGSRDGAAQFREKVSQLLVGDYKRPDADFAKANIDVPVRSVEVDGRAVPGTVRPAILKLIRDNPAGVTRKAIEERTGFKHNSVRGTLWTLMTEKLISRRGDVFVASSKGLESAGQEPSQEPPADQGDKEVSDLI